MAFLDKVTEYAEKAVDKGNELVETQKLKSRISGLNKEITALKVEIADIVIANRCLQVLP